MSYEIHITRKTDWTDEHGPSIQRAEWESYVASDPELEWRTDALLHDARHGLVPAVAWLPGKPIDGDEEESILWWMGDRLTATSPSKPFI